MKWVRNPPPKDYNNDFLIVGNNGKMVVCRWFHNQFSDIWTISVVSENEVHWCDVDWIPLPNYEKIEEKDLKH